MANPEHVEILLKGADAWNAWREKNSHIKPDLSSFKNSRFFGPRKYYIPQSVYNTVITLGKDEYGFKADFKGYDLSNSILDNIDFRNQYLSHVGLTGASMKGCNLEGQRLIGMNLKNVNLTEANLKRVKIINTELSDSCLVGADLRFSIIDESYLQNCDLSQAKVYGVAVWDVNLENSPQKDIIITKDDQAIITVDNLKVAQFVYLLINNSEIRNVIDTLTSKAVLILGRFTADRLKILHSIRNVLRAHGYLPILFDFSMPESRDTTETIKTLAHLSKFIIADLSEPKSVPHELAHIIPTLEVPVKPIIVNEVNGIKQTEYGMFKDFEKYQWVLDIYRYDDEKTLLDGLNENVIDPAISYKKNK